MKPAKLSDKKYSFSFKENKDFWKIIADMLDDKRVAAFERKTNTKIFFQAEKVKTLKEFLKDKKMTYEQAFLLFYDIGNQLEDLEKNNITIPFFSIEDIIVINSKKFLFVNEDKILKIKDGQIKISEPYDDNGFFSPEMKNITELPINITYKSGLFSLAFLTASLLNKGKVTKKEQEKGFYWKTQAPPNENREDLSKQILLLDLIYNTKLYWALERCLRLKPENRYYYFI
jgi:hypothetical protein|tara:strand:- start:19 stop:708 length:690 start_codon:yes stop_codon:yes gene_type:complete